MTNSVLLETLIEDTLKIKKQIELLKSYDLVKLSWRTSPGSWSILECLEHLNLYGDFYLLQIEHKINKSLPITKDKPFRSGLLGGYFAKSMLPKEKINKMKTFKDKNPLNANLDIAVVEKSIQQQQKLLELLQNSKYIDLNKVKIETSISRWIRINLGDTFQFFINHIIRHLKQIERIENSYLKS